MRWCGIGHLLFSLFPFRLLLRRNRRVGKAKRAHRSCGVFDGGHGASAPLPTLRSFVITLSRSDEAIHRLLADWIASLLSR
jgi:hypothetical protein